MPKLKPIASVTRFPAGIIRILGQNPGPMTLQGTNSYLIGKGKSRLLIDTTEENVPEYIELLGKVVKEENCRISNIIATHWHHDHVGSIPALRKNFNIVTEACKVWKFPTVKKDNGFFQYEPLENMQEFEIDDDLKLKVVHTPGHTDDHVILVEEKNKIVFSGDTILGEGTAVFESLYHYMRSLDTISDIKPEVIYPAHGDVIDKSPVDSINFYIKHRNERESQILNAIERSPSALNVLQIVRQVYTTTPIHLWFAAVKVVNQHLEKLKEEKKIAATVGYTGTYWQKAKTQHKL